MRLRPILVLVLLLLPLASLAESSVWRVTTPKGTLYLAGSVHLLRAADYPLPPEFEAAYADAQELVLELDLNATDALAAQRLVTERGLYGSGESIKRHLSPAVYRDLVSYCTAHQLNIAELEQMKPWLLEMRLTLVEMQALGFEAGAGIDTHFAQRAARDGKPLHGLETMEEQINALATFDSQGDPLVASFLAESATYAQQMDEVIGAWRSGDAARMDKYLAREMREKFPAIYQTLLLNRNRRWIDALERWASSGKRVMVVVGAAHLVGDGSVLALLRQRGYAVEQLALKKP